MSSRSELVLLPYNYLLDTAIRNTLKIDWSNSVVIFDEAHNLERVASDAASCSITSTDIANCIHELQNALKLLQESSATAACEALAGGDDKKDGKGSGGGERERPTLGNVIHILKCMFAVEHSLDTVPLRNDKTTPGTDPCAVLDGEWLCGMFAAAGMSKHMMSIYSNECRLCSAMLMEEAQNALGGVSSGMTVSEPKLSLLVTLLDRLHRANSRNVWCDYKVKP
jgi:hypothetical protein